MGIGFKSYTFKSATFNIVEMMDLEAVYLCFKFYVWAQTQKTSISDHTANEIYFSK